jgi:hypothetical protein
MARAHHEMLAAQRAAPGVILWIAVNATKGRWN